MPLATTQMDGGSNERATAAAKRGSCLAGGPHSAKKRDHNLGVANKSIVTDAKRPNRAWMQQSWHPGPFRPESTVAKLVAMARRFATDFSDMRNGGIRFGAALSRNTRRPEH
jgi:hypothetical protein